MTEPRKVPLAAPALGPEERAAILGPLDSGWVTQGPEVSAFEAEFAARHGAPHALATTSGTTALHLALAALGVGPGDEVIVPAFSWIASANVVAQCGAEVVFCDVDGQTYNATPRALERLVGERTKAIMPVHLFGLMMDVAALRDAVGANVAIVEDAACAVAAHVRGDAPAAHSNAAAFSFHPRKTLTTGEGGMLLMRDDALHARAATLRNHGASDPGPGAPEGPARMAAFEIAGFNYRMSDLNAAVGRAQLAKLDRFVEERRRIATAYDEALARLGWLAPPHVPDGHHHAYQAYVARLRPDAPIGRDALLRGLAERGVGCRPGTLAISDAGAFREARGAGECATATALAAETVALPMHNRMTEDDVQYVIATLQDVHVW